MACITNLNFIAQLANPPPFRSGSTIIHHCGRSGDHTSTCHYCVFANTCAVQSAVGPAEYDRQPWHVSPTLPRQPSNVRSVANGHISTLLPSWPFRHLSDKG